MTWWPGGRLRGRSERELGDRYFVMFVCGEGGFSGGGACPLDGFVPLRFGVLGELGASRFSGTKRVRAKDAKDAKVRKGDY